MSSSDDYRENLHKGAKPSTFENARQLRRTETEAEKKLWPYLRNRQLSGKKFRRQHAIANYILDFYCHESKLAIEIDGAIHNSKMSRQYDKARTDVLAALGIVVIRFSNDEVMNNVERVLQRIGEYLNCDVNLILTGHPKK